MQDFLKDLLQQAWHKKSLFFYAVLKPLSWLFAALTFLRRLAYNIGLFKSYLLPVPVIVVGNIHVGGSGKTPVVIWLVQQLQAQGYQPGVISRGYGGIKKIPTPVNANSNPQQVGDEPTLIAKRCACPVWIGANRVKTAQALLQAQPNCNVLISDDGLQHYALKRTLEVAVIDAEHYLTHANLLPAGLLRESMCRLNTVDAMIANGDLDNAYKHPAAVMQAFKMQLNGQIFYNLANPNLTASAADFKQKSVKAMAGIGKPERFYAHLRQLGLTFATVSFDDHHAFNAEDLVNIDCDVLLMTEKDAVKCQSFAKPHYWVLPVSATIADDFLSQVLQQLQQFQLNRKPPVTQT